MALLLVKYTQDFGEGDVVFWYKIVELKWLFGDNQIIVY